VSLSTEHPLVYLISDGSINSQNYPAKSAELLNLVKAAVAFRIPLIQIREKGIPTRRLYELSTAIVKLTTQTLTRVLVNDRLDIALAAGADGVHLTTMSVAADVVRRNVPDDFLIAVSTHSRTELDSARTGGADLAVLGPVFASPGKQKPIGLDAFTLIVDQHPEFPVLALGGIDQTNYRQVLDAGAAGFAAIRFLNNAQNLEKLSLDLGL
jgi:thiamine-phosphate pyrophosphorylase